MGKFMNLEDSQLVLSAADYLQLVEDKVDWAGAIRRMVSERYEILDSLSDLVVQTGIETEDGCISSGALSSVADAMRILVEAGRFKVVRGVGRCITGRFIKE